MTAPSELFCDEEVRDVAEDVFGKLIPEYDSIEIPKSWRDIWDDGGYPHRGMITYEKDGTVVAKMHFTTKFGEMEGHNGKYIVAIPSRLVLELPDGKKFHDRQWLMNEIKEHITKLTELRDTQEAVQCNDENKCICNAFDRVIDDLNDLMEDIRIGGEDYSTGTEVRTHM
jgi:hypothetical protein